MKIKKTSRVGMVLACVLISVLTVGVLAVSATDTPSENLSPPSNVSGFFTKATPYETVTWVWDEDKGEWVKLDDWVDDDDFVTAGDFVTITMTKDGEMKTGAAHFISLGKGNKGIGMVTLSACETEDSDFKLKIHEKLIDGGEFKIFSPHPNWAEISLFYPDDGAEIGTVTLFVSETNGRESGMFTLSASETDGVESGMFSFSITKNPDMKHKNFISFFPFFKDRTSVHISEPADENDEPAQ